MVLAVIVIALVSAIGLRELDSFWIAAAALGVAIGTIVVCALLYRNHYNKDENLNVSWTNLAIALIGSAAVAAIIFASQLLLQMENDERAFKLQLATASDLTGFSPPRDATGKPLGGTFSLHGIHLRGKKLGLSDLDGVDLRSSDLSFIHAAGARFMGAELDGSNLRSSYFYYADLRCACARGVNLSGADLRNTDLRGVDLRDADLRRADLRGSVTDADTRIDASTKLEDACRGNDQERAPRQTCGNEARGVHAKDSDIASPDVGLRADAAPNARRSPRECDPIHSHG